MVGKVLIEYQDLGLVRIDNIDYNLGNQALFIDPFINRLFLGHTS